LDGSPQYLFSGTYEHTLDDKGRLTIPSVFRKDMAEGVVVRKEREGCVEILPRRAWDLFLGKLQAIPRTDVRGQRWVTQQLAAAVSTELDKQGRVLLGPDMKNHAGLSIGTTIVTGALDRLKVWNPARWAEIEKQAQEEDLDAYINEAYQV
jgi:MraZ protein